MKPTNHAIQTVAMVLILLATNACQLPNENLALGLCEAPSNTGLETTGPRFTLSRDRKTLAINEGVKFIRKGEFSAAPSFGSGTLRKSLNTRLGNKLGSNLKEMTTKITSITLPSTLEVIEDHAFHRHRSVQGNLEIPERVRCIGKYAFEELGDEVRRVSSITLKFAEGSQLKSIGEYAFHKSAITSFSLPEPLETIGNNAFSSAYSPGATPPSGTKRMSSFTIPANVRSIGRAAFARIPFGDKAELRILSPYLSRSIGKRSFAQRNTTDRFSPVQMPKSVYDSYTSWELERIFGKISNYQDLNGNSYPPKSSR